MNLTKVITEQVQEALLARANSIRQGAVGTIMVAARNTPPTQSPAQHVEYIRKVEEAVQQAKDLVALAHHIEHMQLR